MPFRKLTLNIILLHPISQRFPRHPVLVRRRVYTVALLDGYESVPEVLRGVLLVGLLLEHVGLDVDDGARAAPHEARARHHAREPERGARACNKQGKETALRSVLTGSCGGVEERGVPFPGFLQEGRGVKSEEKPLDFFKQRNMFDICFIYLCLVKLVFNVYIYLINLNIELIQ